MTKTITFFAVGGLQEPSGIKYIPLGREFVKRGYNVQCLTLHPHLKSLSQPHINVDGVCVYFVGQMQVLKINERKYYFNPIQLLWVVFCSVAGMTLKGLALKTDVIYCFKPQPINGLAALIVKWVKGKPLLLDTDDYEAGFETLSGLQKKIVAFFEDRLPRYAHKVTYNTSFLKQRYVQLGYPENKFVKFQYSPDETFFNHFEENAVERLQQKYSLHKKKVVIYFGALSLRSGHAVDLLIDAFRDVHREIPHAVLLIIGGGEDFDHVREIIEPELKDAVHFTGRVAPEEIPSYLHCAHVSVDPARDTLNNHGRSPWKIFESMVAGVPVVTADIGDRKEYLDQGTAGIIVRPDDPQDLARGIMKILLDDQLAQSMSRRFREIMKNYTWSNLLDNLIR